MKNINFYFSIGSTYTYLSVTRILDVEKKHDVPATPPPITTTFVAPGNFFILNHLQTYSCFRVGI